MTKNEALIKLRKLHYNALVDRAYNARLFLSDAACTGSDQVMSREYYRTEMIIAVAWAEAYTEAIKMLASASEIAGLDVSYQQATNEGNQKAKDFLDSL